MRTIKIICKSGKCWITQANGTIDEIERYFLNKSFYFENYETGKETCEIVNRIVFLD